MSHNSEVYQQSPLVNSVGGQHEPNGLQANGTITGAHTDEAVNGNLNRDAVFMPIAICGMACRLPGGISNPQQLWDFIISKRDAKSKVPSSRYNVDAYYSPVDKPGAVKTPYGYFLDDDLSLFDGSFFSMSPMELERCDPQQRLLLEVAHECIEDAGEVDYRGRPIGVYIGNFGEDWNDLLEKEPQQYGVYRLAGSGDFALANRVSYEMNLQGPSMTVRTACSASLTGLNEACFAISRGDCESAIVGGVSVILTPSMTIKLSEQGVLSPDGSCKSFSADANGYARAEAVNAVYIKPLAAAIRDGNPVRAVIRATSANSDGKTPGMSYPGVDSQEALIRRAYKLAGIQDHSDTAFVECHGTGTLVGDPIETTAVARVFGQSGVHIGSIKPNVGHSEGASGLTSVIKAVLALEHRTIPPNIKYNSPNPKIPFDSGNLRVPNEPEPWPVSKKERVSVNSFGIGGANAHVVLDSAASHGVLAELDEASDKPQLLLYSAKSPESLKTATKSYEKYMITYPERVEDLAYTLINHREHLPYRAFVVASRDQPGTPSPPTKPVAAGNLVMVFTGQGAQWPQMGRDLLRNNPVFKATIKTLDQHLKGIKDTPPSWTIEAELRKPAKTSRLHLAELSQPLCTAVQIGIVDCLAAIGIVPAAVVGHSSGEIAGAYAAGALSAEEAITASFHRGVVAAQQTRPGAMAAIGMAWKEIEPYLIPGVGIACENSPKNVTISGDADKVQEVVAQIQASAPNVLARLLKVDKAYHSSHMAEVGATYYQLVGADKFGKAPSKLFFSSVTGTLLTEEERLDARYFQRNLESPVLFSTAIKSILQHPTGQNAIFLEIGPHSALAGPIRQTLSDSSVSAPYVPTMVRGQSCTEALLSAVGTLYTLHVPIDIRALKRDGSCLPDLPKYPWARSGQYWHETRVSREWRQRKFGHHNLLGVKVVESSDLEPVWRNLFHLDSAPWVRDHRVGDDVVFPFAAYIAMAGEAVRQSSGLESGFKVRNINVSTALILKEGIPAELVTSLRPSGTTISTANQWWDFAVYSYNGQTWARHCTGEVSSLGDTIRSSQALPELPRALDQRRWHEATIRRGGVNFGPSFRRWNKVWAATTGHAAATGSLQKARLGDEDTYHLHPTIIDSALQLLVVAAARGLSLNYRSHVAVGVREMTVFRCSEDLTAAVQAELRSDGIGGEGFCVSGGDLVLEMSGMKLALLEDPEVGDPHAAGRLVWKPSIDFMSLNSMISRVTDMSGVTQQLEGLLVLCLQHSKKALDGIQVNDFHLLRFKDWVLEGYATRASHDPNFGSDSAEVLLEQIQERVHSLLDTPAADCAQALELICVSLEDLISGRSDASALFQSEIMQKALAFISDVNVSEFLRSTAHSRPNLRILELGGGTILTTKRSLEDLGPFYSKYTFAATSSRSLDDAKERLKGVPRVEFAKFDIAKNPQEQGIGDQKYDVVIVANILHKTGNLATSLQNVHQLLKNDGRLLLHELCPSSKWVNYTFGLFSEWWESSNVNQPAIEPYLSLPTWKSELCAAGFDEPECVLDSTEEFQQLSCTMVARATRALPTSKRVTLLHSGPSGSTDAFAIALQQRGYEADLRVFGEALPAKQDVISLLDQGGPFFEGVDSVKLKQFQQLLTGLNSPRGIFWITPLVSANCKDPRYASVLGFARVIRSELDIDFAVCQADSGFAAGDGRVFDVLGGFLARDREDAFTPEAEYLVREGQVYVGRFYPFVLANENLISTPEDRVVLSPGKFNRLRELQWRYSPREPLAPNAVEIDVHLAGLTERDVMAVIKDNTSASLEPQLGLVGGGTVLQTGEAVNDLKAGDTVVFWHAGALASTTTVSQKLCIRVPFTLELDEAVKMIYNYVIALYALFDVGGLERNESVLIRGTLTGAGLAALWMAITNGSPTYIVTEGKHESDPLQLLPRLSPHHVLHLKSDTTVDDLLCETQGRGVDLILDLTPGKLLDPDNRCLAAFGKRIHVTAARAGECNPDSSAYTLNRSFQIIDMYHLVAEQPDKIQRLMQSVMVLHRKGLALCPVSGGVSSVADVKGVLRSIEQDPTEELTVVSMRQPDGELSVPASEINLRRFEPNFHSEASYLLVGGLGGLGRSISLWMVARGARHLIYLSRSAGHGPGDDSFVHELASMGCEAILVQGDVTKQEDVQRAVKSARYPLKGIMQMSIVLRDVAFGDMSWSDWESVVAPKVKGTWTLHNVAINSGVDLDFLVLFSAISGLIGQPGQANYASANTFLDAFCQYRHELGLPASVVQIGPVEDTGIIASNPKLLSQLKSAGLHMLGEREVIDAIAVAVSPLRYSARNETAAETALVNPRSFVIGLRSSIPLNSPKNRCIWRRDLRMASYHNGTATADNRQATNSGITDFLAKARTDAELLKTDDTTQYLAREIGLKVLTLLMKPEEDLNLQAGLTNMGLDSLVGIEVRTWWKQTFGLDITVLELLSVGTLEMLGKHAAKSLLNAFHH